MSRLDDNYGGSDRDIGKFDLTRSDIPKWGRDIYLVLSDLCSPDKAGSKTLDQLLKKMKDHFEPVPNEMAESFKFYTKFRIWPTCTQCWHNVGLRWLTNASLMLT